jgi:hypothetical protein
MARIVETDNHGGDYPDEKFVNLPRMQKYEAEQIAEVVNRHLCPTNYYSRYWRVVEDDYELQPGFEP